MIDENKIEEAKKSFIADKKILGVMAMNDLACGFKEGTKWAINELFKNLWHPVSEEPRKDVSIIVETHNDKNMFYYAWNRWQDNFYPSWTDAVLCSRVSRWLYIDDLLPKKEVSNERA